jgi:hypothetical protein
LLIPCSQELVGSNPTPRACLRVLSQNNKSERAKKSINRSLPKTTAHTTLTLDYQEISNKIDSIASNCSKNFFRKALSSLAKRSPTNAGTICDYLISEQTKLNTKPISNSFPLSLVYCIWITWNILGLFPRLTIFIPFFSSFQFKVLYKFLRLFKRSAGYFSGSDSTKPVTPSFPISLVCSIGRIWNIIGFFPDSQYSIHSFELFNLSF